MYYNKPIKKEVSPTNQPTKFFEQRYVVLAGPFNPSQFYDIRKEQRRLGRDIHSYGLTHNSGVTYCNLFIPTGKMDLAPFGRRIVTGVSSIAMGLLTWAGVMNFVR